MSNQYKKTPHVLIPLTADEINIGDIVKYTDGLLSVAHKPLPIEDGRQSMQLLVLSEDRPQKDDVVLVDKAVGKIVLITGAICEVDLGWSSTQSKPLCDCKKVIAAYPKIEGIPTLSEDIVRQYIAVNGECEINVEMVDITTAHPKSNFEFFLNAMHNNKPYPRAQME